ncbi:hypothetical protein OAU50_02025 [Planctomycetota bacterium]|nr:hypothetical protein [Planctomycetota bacterium]
MRLILPILSLLLAMPLLAKEELVTLPQRESVQLTIYNSEDLTLVRERRKLSFKKGENRLQFSWAGTLIDPTSVELQGVGKEAKDNLELSDTSFPPESHEMLIWTLTAEMAGSHMVEISYFTSGISWNAEYHGLVSADESSCDLTAFITVNNHSGEEYEDASVRLVIGTIHLVEKVVSLAQPRNNGRWGRPPAPPSMPQDDMREMESAMDEEDGIGGGAGGGASRPKQMVKKGLSEYYIFTVEGEETIPNRWSKRLKSFEVKDVPMETVYRLQPKKHGQGFNKFLEFKNDEEHKLGKEPLPDGMLKLYRKLGDGRLSWIGQVFNKYIPKNEEVKINLGADSNVTMKSRRLKLRKKDIVLRNRYISGWTTVEDFEIEIKNFRNKNVKVEIHRSFNKWASFDGEGWVKEDANTQKIEFSLEANKTSKLKFTITTKNGSNRN